MTKLLIDRSAPQTVSSAQNLDVAQQKVVDHRKGLMVVQAGPGTGKTTTLVAAMAARLTGENKLQSTEVLGLTFGRKAALEWRNRVSVSMGGGIPPQVLTFHSFCYGLLKRFASDEEYEQVVRLLSGPEQMLATRETLAEAIETGQLNWPEDLMQAISTRGMADEIRALMSRARTFNMDPEEVSALGRTHGRAYWEAIGDFMELYLQGLDYQGAIDYSELIHRATLLAHRDDVREYLHKFRAVFVDEYQDTDPGQIKLLKSMVTTESALILVGDPDQAIYGFRGANEKAMQMAPDDFSSVFTTCEHVVLDQCHRFGPTIRKAATAVLENLTSSELITSESRRLRIAHLTPTCSRSDNDEVVTPNPLTGLAGQAVDNHIELLSFDSQRSEHAYIVDLVARAHARGIPWNEIAVIVRSANPGIPTLQRILMNAGIPVQVASDEIPLAHNPAVIPLMTMLTVVDSQGHISPNLAWELMTGPLGQLDPVDLRALAKVLRKRDTSADSAPRPSLTLLTECLMSSEALDQLSGEVKDKQLIQVIEGIRALGALITSARELNSSGATPHEVLWHVWQGTPWPSQLEQAAFGFGHTAQRAHRDLDAIMGLFDLANRFGAQGRGFDLTVFIEEVKGQEISGETLAEHDMRNDSVQLLTAHRSKGLQWELVVIADVQEDSWPDLRIRGSVIESERLGKKEELLPVTLREVLATERRLFYVAVTRAKSKVVVCSVDGEHSGEGMRPSRFIRHISERAGIAQAFVTGKPQRALTVDGVIGALRAELSNDNRSPEFKAAVAGQLARLATVKTPEGYLEYSSAHPDYWWGVKEMTHNANRPEKVVLSPTGIDAMETCPVRWMLNRQVKADSFGNQAAMFGSLTHLVAEGLGTGEIDFSKSAIMDTVDRIWDDMGYESDWSSRVMRDQFEEVVDNLMLWLAKQNDFEFTMEAKLVLDLEVPHAQSGEVIPVQVLGFADRIQNENGELVVYDYKTSTKKAAVNGLPRHIQLALYIAMAEDGHILDQNNEPIDGFDGMPVSRAALIQLRHFMKRQGTPDVQVMNAGDHDNVNGEPTLLDRVTKAANIYLSDAVATIESVDGCKNCSVRTLCPAKPEGQQVL